MVVLKKNEKVGTEFEALLRPRLPTMVPIGVFRAKKTKKRKTPFSTSSVPGIRSGPKSKNIQPAPSLELVIIFKAGYCF